MIQFYIVSIPSLDALRFVLLHLPTLMSCNRSSDGKCPDISPSKSQMDQISFLAVNGIS